MSKFFKMLAAESLVDQAVEQQEHLESGSAEDVSAAVNFQAEIDAIKAETQGTDPVADGAGEQAPEAPADAGLDAPAEEPAADPVVDAEAPAEETPTEEVPADPAADEQPPAEEVQPDPSTEQDPPADEQEQEHPEQGSADEQAEEEDSAEAGLDELSAAAEGLAKTLRGAFEVHGRIEGEHKVGHISAAREAMAGLELAMLGSAYGVQTKSPAVESNMSASNVKSVTARVVAFIREMFKRFKKWVSDFYNWAKEAAKAYNEVSSQSVMGKIDKLSDSFAKLDKQLNPDAAHAKMDVVMGTTYKVSGMGPDALNTESMIEKAVDKFDAISALVSQRLVSRFGVAATEILDVIEHGVAHGLSFVELSNNLANVKLQAMFEPDMSLVSNNAAKYMQPSKGTGIVFSNLPGNTTIGFSFKAGTARNIGDVTAIIRSFTPVFEVGHAPADFKISKEEHVAEWDDISKTALISHGLINKAVEQELKAVDGIAKRSERLYGALETTLAITGTYSMQEVQQITGLVGAISQEAISRICSVYTKAGACAADQASCFSKLLQDILATYAKANYNEAEEQGVV